MSPRQEAAIKLAKSLFAEHTLCGWSFQIPKKMPRNGCSGLCDYDLKVIFIRIEYVEHADWDFVVDTIKHEVAHAIAGFAAEHGPSWQRWAVKLGARPEASKCVSMMNIEYLRAVYKLQLCYIAPDGSIERLPQYAKRQSKLLGMMLPGRKETSNNLHWLPLPDER